MAYTSDQLAVLGLADDNRHAECQPDDTDRQGYCATHRAYCFLKRAPY
jgi:hypothetical protein